VSSYGRGTGTGNFFAWRKARSLAVIVNASESGWVFRIRHSRKKPDPDQTFKKKKQVRI